jgi:hypothetical protein
MGVEVLTAEIIKGTYYPLGFGTVESGKDLPAFEEHTASILMTPEQLE